MKLINRRTGLHTIKQIIATSILTELTDQLEKLEEIESRSDYEQYYYNVLSEYFVEDDEGDFILNLYIDKFNAPDPGEVPFINLIVNGNENNDNGTAQNVHSEVNFEVQVYDQSTEDPADQNASEKVEFMTGILKFILENTTIAGIQHKRVRERRFDYSSKEDASNITFSSVIFFVKWIENILIEKTQVTIQSNLTDFSGRFSLLTDNLGD